MTIPAPCPTRHGGGFKGAERHGLPRGVLTVTRFKCCGEVFEDVIVWAGGVWQRTDNGQRYAKWQDAVREYCEQFLRESGGEPDHYRRAIDKAVDSWNPSVGTED